jgi:hypothetical protein
MPVVSGFNQLQPSFVLGTDQWVSTVAEQMVGADIDKLNQLRDHFPFYPLARGSSVLVPRVVALGTAGFLNPLDPKSDVSAPKLAEPPATFEMACLEGSVNFSDYARDVQSHSINQLDLNIELKKIALRIAFWQQFFGGGKADGFKGLPDLASPSQIASLGRTLTLADMDALVAGVKEAEGEMDRKVIVMSGATFVHYVQLVRETGATLSYTTYNGRRYAVHNGVPILLCDFVRRADNSTDVWCMTLGIEDSGVFGVVPEGVGDAGLVIEHVQGAADSASVVYRLRWYCNVIVGHHRGLAGLTKIEVPNPTLTI